LSRRGLDDDALAAGLSPHTVHRHRGDIRTKLEVAFRFAAVAAGARAHVV
jgi:DNA-binding CsgD family transcriptional regulator